MIHIPRKTALETDPPALLASRLALKEGNNKKPIYQIHKWWARRLGSVFRAVLLSATIPAREARNLRNGGFYKEHDLSGLLLLDPFVGGGTSVVEAAKLGANVVGVDIDPVACFVTHKELEGISEASLIAAFQQVEARAKERILKWYRTTLQDGRQGGIIYAFWVDIITCPNCHKRTQGHPHYQLSRNRSTKKQVVFCSSCGEVHTLPLRRTQFQCRKCSRTTRISIGPVKKGQEFSCPKCGTVTPIREVTGRRRLRQELFALQVLVEGTEEKIYKKAEASDRRLYLQAKNAWVRRRPRERFVPRERIPTKGRDDSRPIAYGYKRYSDLFNGRQLLCLSILAEAISEIEDHKTREFIATAFSDCLASNNMFCLYAFDYDKLTPLFGLHAYRRVSRPVENNVWGTEFGRGSFLKCFRKLLRAKKYGREPYENRYPAGASKPKRVLIGESVDSEVHWSLPPIKDWKGHRLACILNQSAENLHPLKSRSVDIILTDPPYYDNLPYSELSDFYHVWLRRLVLKSYPSSRLHTPLSKSMYVRRDRPQRRSRDSQLFVNRLRKAFKECYRVLRTSGVMVFTFHHNDSEAWKALAESITASRFVVTNAFPVRSEGQSEFHSADGNLKWDMVFVCRKSQTTMISAKTALRLQSAALQDFRKWRRILRRAGFAISESDKASFMRGFVLAHLSREGYIKKTLNDLFPLWNGNGRKASIPPDMVKRDRGDHS